MLRRRRLRRRKRRHDIEREREREFSIPESWGRGVAKRGGMRDTVLESVLEYARKNLSNKGSQLNLFSSGVGIHERYASKPFPFKIRFANSEVHLTVRQGSNKGVLGLLGDLVAMEEESLELRQLARRLRERGGAGIANLVAPDVQ